MRFAVEIPEAQLVRLGKPAEVEQLLRRFAAKQHNVSMLRYRDTARDVLVVEGTEPDDGKLRTLLTAIAAGDQATIDMLLGW